MGAILFVFVFMIVIPVFASGAMHIIFFCAFVPKPKSHIVAIAGVLIYLVFYYWFIPLLVNAVRFPDATASSLDEWFELTYIQSGLLILATLIARVIYQLNKSSTSSHRDNF